MRYDRLVCYLLAVLGLFCISVGQLVAQEDITWAEEFYDPAAAGGTAADLVLPMPCGGAMAFQRVVVLLDSEDPLSDRRVRLGTSQSTSGYSEYLRVSHLRGPFQGVEPNSSHFYIGRYEVTAAQASALRGECEVPTMRSRTPKVGLSWFDAMLMTRDYTEWLQQHAATSLPSEEGALGFIRLPTEVEWEFAARGGVAVDPATFSSRRFPHENGIDDLAWHQGNSRDSARPVGVRAPNPLGLFDIYGNAAELVLDLFRMNAVGREHGQVGGVITRGGSFRTEPEQLYSAKRSERPIYSVTSQRANALPFVGARFAIAVHVSVSDQRVADYQNSWIRLREGDTTDMEDPLAELGRVIEQETDQQRLDQLNGLRQMVWSEQERSKVAQRDTLKSSLASGAAFVLLIRKTDRQAQRSERNAETLTTRIDSMMSALSQSEVAESESLERLIRARDSAVTNMKREHSLRNEAFPSYTRVLQSVANHEDRLLLREAYDLLVVELQYSEAAENELLASVCEFWDDVLEYQAVPELDSDELLALARSPAPECGTERAD